MAEGRYEERVYRRMSGEGPAFGRPISNILTDLLQQFTMLIKQEGQLARTEVSENVSRAITGVVMAVAAAVLLVPALVILLLAAVFGLESTGLEPWLCARAADDLRNRSMEDLVDSFTRFARRQPAAAFAGSVLAGFVLSRFLKSAR
jgi:uncharacterized membrane protein YdfJ with MMPL/SSD domain